MSIPAAVGAVVTAALMALTSLAAPACAAEASAGEDVLRKTFETAGSIVARGPRDAMELRTESITLTGELRLPRGVGPFPAVILAHGCMGNGYAEQTWAPRLRAWGYATFVVDSLAGRGLKEVCSDFQKLYAIQRVPDVYGALRTLSAEPRIDAGRIALMGFSHGGITTLSAATNWARDAFAPPGQPRFRAFFPVYPYCNAIVPEYGAISAPLRIHAGALDDWTPAAPCVSLTAELRRHGFDAGTTVHAGAHHAFDAPFGAVVSLPWVTNLAACFPRYLSILGPSEQTEPYATCVRRGATAGRNMRAIEAMRQVLEGELATLLAPGH
jgi:dienelactone hydrolase